MKRFRFTLLSSFVLAGLLISACGGVTFTLPEQAANLLTGNSSPTAVAVDNQPVAAPVTRGAVSPGLLQAYEGVLADIYDAVSPSVVNIQVTQQATSGVAPQFPFDIPGFPNSPDTPGTGQTQVALGSGFVWDAGGFIVTNNHVIDGADTIEVTFSDGTSVPAEVVGADPDTDLAVLKVDAPKELLLPVQVGDSNQIGVGDLAVAIGNPFGLEGTMTVGIISALGRSLPANETVTAGPNFSIPEIIQTDAAINPGNSGGVLLNDQGQVIGVTSAIESPVRANSGVGFAIPSALVKRVVPALVESGHFDHPYLGITGTSLTRDLSEAMNLDSTQRGALVEDVVTGGPADKAGLQGSTSQTAVAGSTIPVGGDVVIAINGTTVKTMDELITYLMNQTQVGDTVTLTVLRDGKQVSVDVTLESRPQANQVTVRTGTRGQVYLGVRATTLTPDISQSMNLPADQQGVLVEQVELNSPAAQAGLEGGDVIIAFDNRPITSIEDLRAVLEQAEPGTETTLTILRNGKELSLTATLVSPVLQP
jgi:serine protease Do